MISNHSTIPMTKKPAACY